MSTSRRKHSTNNTTSGEIHVNDKSKKNCLDNLDDYNRCYNYAVLECRVDIIMLHFVNKRLLIFLLYLLHEPKFSMILHYLADLYKH